VRSRFENIGAMIGLNIGFNFQVDLIMRERIATCFDDNMPFQMRVLRVKISARLEIWPLFNRRVTAYTKPR
jgi:hypothetical protein